MQKRQQTLLDFIKDPLQNTAVWEEAHWPQKFEPDDESDWLEAVNIFEKTLGEVIAAVDDPQTDLYQVRQNGKTVLWAAMALLHHNGYHIDQMKAIGRQLGVW